MKNTYLSLLFVIGFALPIMADESIYPLRFEAPEARQGIAVDEKYAYAVGATVVGKYDKFTGELIQHWEPDESTPLIHLDSGVIHEGKLYCSHSNYPELPMISSVEIWDAATLEHIGTHSFGIMAGSCTWIDCHEGYWWVMFANYNNDGGYPDRPNSWTTLVKLDDNWQRLQAWVFPKQIVERFGAYSCSGGSWGPDGLLYCTGHDHAELYAMRLPKAGSVLELIKIVPFINYGQGIAFDRWQPGILYGIVKSSRTVVADKIINQQ